MTQLSDEFLLAYIDGQLERRQASEVAQLARTNPEISRRVQRLKRSQALLIDRFGAIARQEIAVPKNVLQFESSEAKPSFPGKSAAQALNASRAMTEQFLKKDPEAVRNMLFVAAVFISGVVGGYGGSWLTGPTTPAAKDIDRAPAASQASPSSWSGDIERFHTFFPRETLTPYPDAISNPELIRFQLTKITAKALTPPDFTRYGYALYRGQTFNYRQERMMQLTYASKTDAPITLYALPAADLPDSPLAVHTLGSTKSASWVTDRVRFLLTAEKNEEDLRALALWAQGQMPKKN